MMYYDRINNTFTAYAVVAAVVFAFVAAVEEVISDSVLPVDQQQIFQVLYPAMHHLQI